jgi:hypothetical protein
VCEGVSRREFDLPIPLEDPIELHRRNLHSTFDMLDSKWRARNCGAANTTGTRGELDRPSDFSFE